MIKGDLWADLTLLMETPSSDRGALYAQLQTFPADYRLELFDLWDKLNPLTPDRTRVP